MEGAGEPPSRADTTGCAPRLGVAQPCGTTMTGHPAGPIRVRSRCHRKACRGEPCGGAQSRPGRPPLTGEEAAPLATSSGEQITPSEMCSWATPAGARSRCSATASGSQTCTRRRAARWRERGSGSHHAPPLLRRRSGPHSAPPANHPSRPDRSLVLHHEITPSTRGQGLRPDPLLQATPYGGGAAGPRVLTRKVVVSPVSHAQDITVTGWPEGRARRPSPCRGPAGRRQRRRDRVLDQRGPTRTRRRGRQGAVARSRVPAPPPCARRAPRTWSRQSELLT